jgi:DNA polymerase-3 subunit delta'
LPTILSRCQSLRFSPLSESQLTGMLVQKLGCSETEALKAARLGNGSFRKAELFCKPEGREKLELAEGLLEAAASQSLLKKLAWAEAVAEEKAELPEVLDLAGLYLRELAVRRLELGEGLRFWPEAPAHGRSLSLEKIEALLAGLSKVREALRHHASAPLALELLALAG